MARQPAPLPRRARETSGARDHVRGGAALSAECVPAACVAPRRQRSSGFGRQQGLRSLPLKGLLSLTATARSRVIASGGALQGHRRGPVAACRPCWSIGGPTAPGNRTRRVLGARYSGHLGRRKRRQPAARPRILHTRRHDQAERARCRVMVRAACEGRLWPQQVHQTDLKACRRRAVVARARDRCRGAECSGEPAATRATKW